MHIRAASSISSLKQVAQNVADSPSAGKKPQSSLSRKPKSNPYAFLSFAFVILSDPKQGNLLLLQKTLTTMSLWRIPLSPPKFDATKANASNITRINPNVAERNHIRLFAPSATNS